MHFRTLGLLGSLVISQAAAAQSLPSLDSRSTTPRPLLESQLPSIDTRAALESLPIEGSRGSSPTGQLPWARDLTEDFQVGNFTTGQTAVRTQPIIIKLERNVTAEELEEFVAAQGLRVVDTIPSIGVLTVEADLTPFVPLPSPTTSPTERWQSALDTVIDRLEADPRIRTAAPDAALTARAAVVSNIDAATSVEAITEGPERLDWGVEDIRADVLWAEPGTRNGTVVAVFDAGFAPHQDLTFLGGLPPSVPADDHGNHVAGIACGRPNGVGMRGVLPNCFVVAGSAEFFLTDREGEHADRFIVQFSEILRSLASFVEARGAARTFNVSLGYNWVPNFGIDPDGDASGGWRSRVQQHGVFALAILELAAERDYVIFSAAGNDSTGRTVPIEAEFASPFNWAAINGRRYGIDTGVVVEAHDPEGRRAEFSNAGGHISCPGVDILSTVAFHAGRHSETAYGLKSGTSMASPYCAAGFELLRLALPHKPAADLVACIEASADRSTSGTPMMRLDAALDACR